MANCGEAHGEMKTCVEGHEEWLKDLSAGLKGTVSFRLFAWLMGAVAIAMMGLVGYTYGVDRQLASGLSEVKVLQAETRHISDTVQRIDRKLDRMNGNRDG